LKEAQLLLGFFVFGHQKAKQVRNSWRIVTVAKYTKVEKTQKTKLVKAFVLKFQSSP
jgi:hypothetical protein